MSGTLDLQSEVGKGSSFTVVLPFVTAELNRTEDSASAD
jgi:hypothetical protein